VQLTLLSGLDRFNRVLTCRDTFLTQTVIEALELARFDRSLVAALEQDIERAARAAKKVRLMDWQYELEKTEPLSPLLDLPEPSDFDWMDASELGLDPGRPRVIDGELLLVLLSVNSLLGLSSVSGYERLVESEVFGALLGAQCRKRPARSTVADYLSVATAESRQRIQEAVCRKAKAEGLDDFAEVTVDSTAVEANSAWPTDSGLIWGFLRQASRLLGRQAELTGVECTSSLVERWLEDLERQHKAISLLPSRPGSVKKRVQLYRKLLRSAGQAHAKLRWLLDARRDQIEDCCISPGRRLRVDAIMAEVARSMAGAGKVMEAARLRVLESGKVAAADRAFSLADPDAWMIEKGDRDPVLGYKPQIARSANGFITAFEVLPGNPADSTRLVELTSGHIRNTGVTPCLVATDDGYSAQGNLDELASMGVETVSFSGAKGRDLLGDQLWEGTAEIRSDRSAVESTIFTLKHLCGLRRFCRRGIEGVNRDLAEAVLTYNLWRLAWCRHQRHARQTAAA
jgi:hypothetical protein